MPPLSVSSTSSSVSKVYRPRLTTNFTWAFLGAVVGQGTSFAAAIVLARLLGRAEYGKLTMLTSSLGMLSGFAALGLGTAATKFLAELAHREPKRAGKLLGLFSVATALTGIVFSGVLLWLAPAAAKLFKIPGLDRELRIAAVYVWFFSQNAFQQGGLAGLSAFRTTTRVGVVQGMLNFGLTCGLAWWRGLEGAAIALALSSALSWWQYQRALTLECAALGIRISYRGLGEELGVVTKFALPAALSGAIGGAAIMLANTAVVRTANGVQEMATFGVANTIRIAVMFVPGLVSRVSTPLLCRLRGDGDRRKFGRTLRQVLLFNGGIVAVTSAVIFTSAPFFLGLFGKEFVQGRSTLGLLLGATVFETLALAFFQVLYSYSRMLTHLLIMLLWSLLLAALTAIGAAALGARALAGSYLVAWAAALVLYGVAAMKSLGAAAVSENHEAGTLST